MAEFIVAEIFTIDALNEYMLFMKSQMARMKSEFNSVLRLGWEKVQNQPEKNNNEYREVRLIAEQLQSDYNRERLALDDVDSDEDFDDEDENVSVRANVRNIRRREEIDDDEDEMVPPPPPALRNYLVSIHMLKNLNSIARY